MSAISNTDYIESKQFYALVTCEGRRMGDPWPFDWRPMIGDSVEVDDGYFTVTRVSFDMDALLVFIHVVPGVSR